MMDNIAGNNYSDHAGNLSTVNTKITNSSCLLQNLDNKTDLNQTASEAA